MSPLARGELTLRQAEREILAILDRIPDSQLPKPDRIETDNRDDDGCAWFGGKGFCIRPRTWHTAPARAAFGLLDVFPAEWLYRERTRRYGKNFEFVDGKQIWPRERAS